MMRDFIESMPFVVLLLIAGLVAGWMFSSMYWLDNIAADCQHLGKFRYLGDTYICTPQGKGSVMK